MLYGEFLDGTGCRDNEHNYKVYRDLEVMYMNSDMSKQEVYEYGKKLVDNSESPEVIELRNQYKAEIADLKDQMKRMKQDMDMYSKAAREEENREYAKIWKDRANWYKSDIKACRRKIRELKWLMQ